MKKNFKKEIRKVEGLVEKINSFAWEDLGMYIRKTQMDVFDINRGCEPLPLTKYEGNIYFGFGEPEVQFESAIKYLKERLEVNEAIKASME